MHLWRVLLVASSMVFLAACNPIAVLDGAEEEVATFHANWNAQDHEEMWRRTHPDFREGPTHDQFVAMLQDLHEKLGDVVGSERSGFNINANNGTTIATVTMTTQFDEGEGTETFVLRERGNGWGVVHYTVESPLLDDYVPSPAVTGGGEQTGSEKESA